MNACFKKTHCVTLLAAVLAGLAGGAWAESPTPDPYTHMTGTLSRAQVRAELHAARASGQMTTALIDEGREFRMASDWHTAGRTRAEVRAEVLAAAREGQIAAMNGEDSGSFHLARLQQRADGEAVRLAALTR